MQAASQRFSAPLESRVDPASVEPGGSRPEHDHALLHALPIAASIFTLNDGKLWIEATNKRFLELAGCNGATESFMETFKLYAAGAGGMFTRHYLLDAEQAVDEIELADGDGITRRFLRLKLSPLAAGPGQKPWCLLSVVDKTVEIRAENNLRAEMLRDSLTGLPNRLAFSEAIECAGEKVARDLEHAVLVVDMLRFSRINESMGGLAGDELLITFARRLILALRTGDILARTGGNEFGVLVSLRRGVKDALKAAERIQEIMATPFKLSELEIQVECAIGVALMGAR